MSVFEHQRFEIFNATQHPYRHTLSEFHFSHPALTGDQNLENALGWLFNVLYPNSQDAVATPGDLPLVGNSLWDYRVVLDDGDGKAASYRWEQREGDASPQWYKVYDLDWSSDSILSGLLDKTQDVYVFKYGRDDVDANGDPLTGADAGQSIIGGHTANSHLTLYANSGDGVGPATGFVQFGDNVRPKSDSIFSLGTTDERFLKIWTDEITVGTMTITDGSIVDSSGVIDFDDEDLSTTGDIFAANVFADLTVEVTDGINSIVIQPGSITDNSGAISFNDEDLSTTGDISATSFVAGTLTISDGSIVDSDGAIDFGNNDLSTTGDIDAATATFTDAFIGNIEISGNTLSASDLDGNLNLEANGTGHIEMLSDLVTMNISAVGDVDVIGSLEVDNINIDGNTISSVNTDGNVIINPNGTGLIEAGSGIFPTNHSAEDLGKTGNVWNKLWLDGSIGDGTNDITMATLLSLRDINAAASAGMTIFYDGSKWVPSVPDTEVDHGSVSGLLDDDHTQYALLAGRATGQTINGGNDASENLTLSSTSHASKGFVIFADNLRPGSDNNRDIGSSSFRVQDLYMGGEAIGLRFQNEDTLGRPSASANNVGRQVWDTDLDQLFVDTGGAWKRVGINKYELEDTTNWNGSVATQSYDVSSLIPDARRAVWEFLSNADGYEKINLSITKTQTHVTVTSLVNLPNGTYTLVGVH